ncbi:MAG: peptidylprolyl isomerase [Bacteroidales bacterium]|nr:peptidylprolyl isomerase [Bacteroidales bacterium]
MLTANMSAQENIIDEVVWIVGDEAILKSQVEQERLRRQYEGEKIKGDPYCIIPEEMAVMKLFLHQAKLDSIEATDAEVFQEVEAKVNYYIQQLGSKEKVEEIFNKNMSELREELRDNTRDMKTMEKMQMSLVEGVKATPVEVRRFYQSLSKDSIPFMPEQYEVEIITFEPKIPQSEIDDIKNRLRDYTDRINKGEQDFSTIALLYSQDPGTAKNGGELGFKGRGSFVPEFAQVAFSLNDTKKVSKIVQTEFGYHIIQLIEKRGDRSNFRHVLLTPQVSEKELSETLVRMDSLKMDLDSAKFTFEEICAYVSHDKNTRNNHGLMVNPYTRTSQFQLEQLPVEVATRVKDMKVNDISSPFVMKDENKNKQVVAIIKLKSKVEGHKATVYDDYQALKDMLESSKRNKIIQDFIKKKQRETYIKIKDGWANCEFEYPGWVRN